MSTWNSFHLPFGFGTSDPSPTFLDVNASLLSAFSSNILSGLSLYLLLVLLYLIVSGLSISILHRMQDDNVHNRYLILACQKLTFCYSLF